jgi:membrane associated rhomboid family serine protease
VDQVVRTLGQRPWALVVWPALAMIAASVLRAMLGKRATALAVVPRTAGGLVGIITAPFVHCNLGHLAANLPPFVVLGLLMLRLGEATYLRAAVAIVFGSGILLWLLGRNAAHMGMSGVIFGFFGYLVALAFLRGGIGNVAIAVAVLIVYGSMLAGIKPARTSTSWESHLFGLAAGVGAAWLSLRW